MPGQEKCMTEYNGGQQSISLDQALSNLSKYIAKFLEKEIPSIFGSDWWKKGVIDQLSEQQKKIINQQKIDSLIKLDIAALLRVFDKNWYSLSVKLLKA